MYTSTSMQNVKLDAVEQKQVVMYDYPGEGIVNGWAVVGDRQAHDRMGFLQASHVPLIAPDTFGLMSFSKRGR